MFKILKFAFVALVLGANTASAEFELSVYAGFQTSPHSRARGDYPVGSPNVGSFDALIKWNGKSFEAPPYYGLRGTWWRTENFGLALELTHAKVYAADVDRAAIGFDRLEFTDGLNLLTVNAMYRWPNRWKKITPYVGAGVGVAIPHVDAITGTSVTFGYQYTGLAARLIAGGKYDLNDKWALFGEYQFTISQNEAELDGGGSLNTRIITNALNFGVSYGF